MSLTRTIRELELAIATEDADDIYEAITSLIAQIGDQAASAVTDVLLAERRTIQHQRSYQRREPIFVQCA